MILTGWLAIALGPVGCVTSEQSRYAAHLSAVVEPDDDARAHSRIAVHSDDARPPLALTAQVDAIDPTQPD